MKILDLISDLLRVYEKNGNLEVEVCEPGPSAVYPLKAIRIVGKGKKKKVWQSRSPISTGLI
jgi:hypothetical protein